MALSKKAINLLPKTELERTPIGKFLKWTLSIGRYIVIFTELVAIVAFLVRFKLDRDLTKLYEEIEEKKTIVSSFEKLENDVRLFQKKLQFIGKTEAETIKGSFVLEELSKLTPVDMKFSELTIDKDSISVQGTSLSTVGLNTFLNGLKTSENFSEINLTSISSQGKRDPTLEFELGAKLEKS